MAVVKRRALVTSFVRLAVGKQRLDLGADSAAGDKELGRAFGAAAPMVTAAIERLDALGRLAEPILATSMTLPPAGFWERRELGRLESLLPRAGHDPLGPLAAEHPFRAMAAAPAALTTALAPSDVGVVTEARAFALARRGLHVLEGGLAALQELLLQRIETFGGERRRRLEPIGVVMRRGRAVGLQVSPRDERIGCQWLLWAGSSASLRATLGPSAPQLSARGATGGAAGGGLSLRPVAHRRPRGSSGRHTIAPAGDRQSGAAAHRGQRLRGHRRSPGPARAGSTPGLDRMRRPGPPGRCRAQLPAGPARATAPDTRTALARPRPEHPGGCLSV